jgi:hypothetical protein
LAPDFSTVVVKSNVICITLNDPKWFLLAACNKPTANATT